LIPTFGDLQIGAIKRRKIAALLDEIEERRYTGNGDRKLGGPVMADHVLAALRKLMNWHAARDDDFMSPIVKGMFAHKIKGTRKGPDSDGRRDSGVLGSHRGDKR
jgi:hypothetical protein